MASLASLGCFINFVFNFFAKCSLTVILIAMFSMESTQAKKLKDNYFTKFLLLTFGQIKQFLMVQSVECWIKNIILKNSLQTIISQEHTCRNPDANNQSCH